MSATDLSVESIKLSGNYFGEDTKLLSLDSHVDNEKKGGDYDFLIEMLLYNPDEIIVHKREKEFDVYN